MCSPAPPGLETQGIHSFNHSDIPDTQIETDEDVCSHCGHLPPCGCDNAGDKDQVDDALTYTVDMRANHEITACSQAVEIFDTYGPHQSSAQLLLRYDFRIEGNDADVVPISATDVHDEPLSAEEQSQLYIDSEGEPSEILKSLLHTTAFPLGHQAPKFDWCQRLLNITWARLERLHFHEKPVEELLDRQEEFHRKHCHEQAEALGYLISQRLILEGCRAMCLECITDES